VLPARPPLLTAHPPAPPLLPPLHVVDLMTAEGSAVFAATWRAREAKLVQCPALGDAMPEFPTTYDIEPHAEERGFDDADWTAVPATDLGGRRGGGMVSFCWYRATLTVPVNALGFDTAGAMAVLRVNVDDYAEIWINGEMPRAAGRPSPYTIQGFNMPHRIVLATEVSARQLRARGVRDQRSDIGRTRQFPVVPRGQGRIFPVTGGCPGRVDDIETVAFRAR